MSIDNSPIEGSVAPGFEEVATAFSENFAEGLEVGAGFAVVREGETLVDLWGGYGDAGRTVPVAEHSLFNLFSTTKGLAALSVAMLVERGALDYEAPVSRYWPEFAANGKASITVAQLMSHQAGLCGPRQTITWQDYYDHRPAARLLAQQAPFFEPGTAWGYHAISYGTLAEELVRRTAGETLSRFFAKEVAEPLQLDIHLGLSRCDLSRQLPMIEPDDGCALTFDSPNHEAFWASGQNPPLSGELANGQDWRRAGLAAAGGSSNARNLARLYGALVAGSGHGGRRLLSPDSLATATRQRIAGVDQVSGSFGRYASGFRLNHGQMGACPAAFGHGGLGGSIAFADPLRKLGVAYVMNKMATTDWSAPDPRSRRLIMAVYRALNRQTG